MQDQGIALEKRQRGKLVWKSQHKESFLNWVHDLIINHWNIYNKMILKLSIVFVIMTGIANAEKTFFFDKRNI